MHSRTDAAGSVDSRSAASIASELVGSETTSVARVVVSVRSCDVGASTEHGTERRDGRQQQGVVVIRGGEREAVEPDRVAEVEVRRPRRAIALPLLQQLDRSPAGGLRPGQRQQRRAGAAR
ncbi:hypothetical protein [Agromyces ramosus]|uniref:hypothetical protein n=1 Tax=Agromyces ramosus TaxID=33879 RepID=UPI0027D76F86|nr:hypothetical protein [Agromyces ramosus]